MTTHAPIPQPKPDLLLGNIRDMDSAAPVQGLMRLARTYGPIYRLDLPGRRAVVVSSQALVNEVCDETRFDKKVHTVLRNVRDFAGDGLFTAETTEPNWGRAHRILMPAFGPIGIRGMFDQMVDIADQMLTRWERFGEAAVLDVPDQMTRLTLDTIALCAFDYRFNSFYQNEMHPFVDAMVDGLAEAGARSRRPDIATKLQLLANRRYAEDIRLMHEVADELIAARRRDPDAAQKNDLLGRMLQARDPISGEGLSDENIRYQMVTFLIAGHETTSGMLSFALYLLLKNPEVLQRARGIVDDVLGDEAPRVEQLPALRYLDQVLMESLRLWPTAPVFGLKPLAETVIGGKYAINTDDVVMVLAPMLHRDPAVWGADVEAFRPERFDPDAELALPPDAWKPFGNGQRACIGRPFAMQEATLVLAMLLQRFDLIEDDPSYTLHVKETLTLKPEGFRIRARRRGTATHGLRVLAPVQRTLQPAVRVAAADGNSTPLLVLYGSNTGSAEAFAQRIASDAAAHGFAADVAPLDERVDQLPREGVVVLLSASYEGQPPDNARQFVAWMDGLASDALIGVQYAVFGCGNRQWARTYQAVPTRLDSGLEAAGATRLLPRGEADASADFFGAFDAWIGSLWPALAHAFGRMGNAGNDARIRVERVDGGRSSILRQGELQAARVLENRELVDMRTPGARSKRHLEIALPKGMGYRAGDYLAVLPRNANSVVDRAMQHFGFAPDSLVAVQAVGGSMTSLPTGHPVSVHELLANYVELAQPATRLQVAALAALTRCPPERQALEALAEEANYLSDVLERRTSVLDLLQRHASCELGFAAFLEMLPPLRVRQYSISSSPLHDVSRCTLTVAVVNAPALSGQGQFRGTASSYLAGLEPGTQLSVAVRPSNKHFHPPQDPRTPMVLICAGTGLAPFRGFLQERALQRAAGQQVGPALLFFGCDAPDVDYLYRDELERWQSEGVVQLRPAFSTHTGEVRFVQHRVWQDREEVAAMFREGAIVYLCGDGQHMAPAVRETLIRIYCDATNASTEEAQAWADTMQREYGRYVEDIFA